MASPTTPSLPDELLAEILILLPTLADLDRACAACTTFRRVIRDPSFLCRLHALHPPSLLGFVPSTGGFHRAVVPRHSAARARALAAAGDFAFSFLPEPGPWLDLAAAVEHSYQINGRRRCDLFLAPCGEEEEGTQNSFRVICNCKARCPTKPVAFVFSSVSGHWQRIASPRWSDLSPDMASVSVLSALFLRSYAHGCFYRRLLGTNGLPNLIVLDTTSMEFSAISLPAGYRISECAIVELGENRIGMFAADQMEPYVLQLFSKDRQDLIEGAGEWVLENQVTLPESRNRYDMLGVADGKLLLLGGLDAISSTSGLCLMLLDFKTSQLYRASAKLGSFFTLSPQPVPYASLSSPTV
ncbi:unnamed protein product [Urochloa decumbens]|uniref:F-box domain-containing protein n=1 Tax=Urochloa decumbens TaxID=240449 RepID=A0ABC9FE77_9POAL